MVEVDGTYYETEEDAHKAVQIVCENYRREQERLTEDERRSRAAGDEFFSLLRKRHPALFERRLISLPLLREHKSAVRDTVKAMKHSVSDLGIAILFGRASWPVRISEAANREFQYWIHEMKGPEGQKAPTPSASDN